MVLKVRSDVLRPLPLMDCSSLLVVSYTTLMTLKHKETAAEGFTRDLTLCYDRRKFLSLRSQETEAASRLLSGPIQSLTTCTVKGRIQHFV